MEWTIVWFIDEWEWINNENICEWNHLRHQLNHKPIQRNHPTKDNFLSLCWMDELIGVVVDGCRPAQWKDFQSFHFAASSAFHSINKT